MTDAAPGCTLARGGGAQVDRRTCVSDPLAELKKLDRVETAKEHDRERAERLALTLLDELPDALVVTDLSGVIVMVNKQTELMFGCDRSQILGRAVECLIPERLRAGHVGHREQFGQYGVASTVRVMGGGLRLVGLHSDGREFPTEIMLTRVVADGAFLVASIRHSPPARLDA